MAGDKRFTGVNDIKSKSARQGKDKIVQERRQGRPEESTKVEDIAKLDDLIAKARLGEREAYAEVYRLYYRRILSYVFARTGNESVAEDISQETFLGAFKRIPEFDGTAQAFASWLFRIAHNITADHYRREGRRKKAYQSGKLLDVGPGTPEDATIEAFEHQQVREAMGRLPSQQREVLLLRFSGRLSTREMSNVLGKSENAVKVLQHRALNRLKKILGVNFDVSRS